jgi:hypothetical protein
MRPWICAAVGVGIAALAAEGCGGDSHSSSTTTTKGECFLYFGADAPPSVPDGAQSCGAGVCNYQAQTGCTGTEMCWPLIDSKKGTVTPTCRPPGAAKKGEACGGNTLCGTGLFCDEGTCHKMCCGGDWSACDPDESCIRQAEIKVGDAGLAYAGFDLCYPIGTCDIFDPTACASEGRVCGIVDPLGDIACKPNTTLALGDACDHEHQCGQGLLCAATLPDDATAFENGTCRKLCRFGACGTPSCSADEGLCVHFLRDPSGVGECTPGWQGPGVGVSTDGGTSFDGDAASDASR